MMVHISEIMKRFEVKLYSEHSVVHITRGLFSSLRETLFKVLLLAVHQIVEPAITGLCKNGREVMVRVPS